MSTRPGLGPERDPRGSVRGPIRARIAWLLLATCAGCTRQPAPSPDQRDLVTARRAADMLHAVLAADRAVYSVEVMQRGGHGDLPLPAHMFRMSADRVRGADLAYFLLSPWSINRQNRPRTETERVGVDHVVKSGQPLYASEELDRRRYFIAFYPDVAVAEVCASCHNAHPDSPRRDFAAGDAMGAIVIRFPLPTEVDRDK
jgi:hypothetical protein